MTSFSKDQPAEILSDERSLRLVRLDFYYDQFNMSTREVLAQLGEGLVTLISMSDNRKPKKVTIDPDNMTRLAIAWLAFLSDCKTAEEQEQAKFQAEIEQVRERAKAIGAVMTDFDRTRAYNTFNLSWPMGHALERYNHHWQWGNENLSLDDVQDRLKQVETHMAIVQTEAVENPRHIDSFEKLIERAVAVGAATRKEAPGYYDLFFPEGHAFHGFWNSETLLSIGQVQYRLNYVEGVMQQQALQK